MCLNIKILLLHQTERSKDNLCNKGTRLLAELNEYSKASSTSLCHVHFNLTSRYSDPVISLFDTHKLDNTRLQNIPTPVSKPVSSC